MDMKRSKVQCKIFVEEYMYISASFLLWCSMWLQLFLSHQQLHIHIQIQTVACLYTNTNDEIIERFECRHDLSQVFIFWLLLSWTKQTLFKMSKFVKLLSSVWVEKFAFREEHWFLQRVLTPLLTQALDQSSPIISNNNEADYTLSSLNVLSIDVNRYIMADVSVHGAISRCHKIKWHKSPFT